ncbi:MAG: transcriptional regulator, partial [Cyanobacteria bacterium J06648_11]
DLLVLLVETYEREREVLPESDPLSMLQFLMAQRGLAQADLVGVIGSSGVVSEVVNGKREISKGQAKALGEFFSVDYHLFL